ncbi:hypothetical protein ACFTWH_28220 [Streptomyces sp. NPDC057011]|uniref:hypothetical protein n=1 Tax=unclassified Streptomyces TaxID=2593676 RepID=UPI00362A68FA
MLRKVAAMHCCRRPKPVARPLLAAFALSQVLVVGGLVAQPAAAVAPSAAGEGRAAGAAHQPLPPPPSPRPPSPRPPSPPAPVAPGDEAKRAEANCSARAPGTATPEDRQRFMSACMQEYGYPWTPPQVQPTPTERPQPVEPNPPADQPPQVEPPDRPTPQVDPNESGRAEAEANCAARVPGTATPEERQRIISVCLQEAGYP